MPDRTMVDSSVSEDVWRDMLTKPSPIIGRRRLLGRIPSAPRCKMCTRPFGGLGGLVMSARGLGPWTKNAKYCTGCFRDLRQKHGGAEVECSLLFADVRGSTPLAEQLRPREFNQLMGSFYDTATNVLVRYDAIVDAFVGDEVVAMFVPAMAGADHGRRAVEAAIDLLSSMGLGRGRSPVLPIGVGLNVGDAYVGAIGEGPDTELRALGDTVNVAARLASAAGAGEILLPTDAAKRIGLDGVRAEKRSLELKGKAQPLDVMVFGVDSVLTLNLV
jgi:adenylate cyclase